MKLIFTREGCAAFYTLICNTQVMFKVQQYYVPEDSSGVFELAKLHRFCEQKLSHIIKKTLKRPTFNAKGERGPDEEIEQELREWTPGKYSLDNVLIQRAITVIRYYQKIKDVKEAILLPLHYAELELTFAGKNPKAELDQYGVAGETDEADAPADK